MIERSRGATLVPSYTLFSVFGAVVMPVALAAMLTAVLEAPSEPARAEAGEVDAAHSAQGCPPEIIHLPATRPDESGRATALNDHGWVVGSVYAARVPFRAVLWRNNQAPIELGVGGSTGPGRTATVGLPVDVNESGVVAIQRFGQNADGNTLRPASFLWQDGTLMRLPGSRYRPAATVNAINDAGVAVGSIQGRGKPARPVVWRDGELRRLPRPAGSDAIPLDINNAGLAVGYTIRPDINSHTPWWWHTTFERGGPLSIKLGDRPRTGVAASVDEEGRIVGNLGPVVKWRRRGAAPQKLFSRAGVSSLHTSGKLTGSAGGFRGMGDRAWIARITDTTVTQLPDPVLVDADAFIANTFGLDIAQGATAYAPHGGITVAGQVDRDDGAPDRATVWTCAQTYLPPNRVD